MDCNSFESYKKNKSPYAKKVCCPNLKREAKKWGKIKYKNKTLCIKTCCSNCINTIQNSLDTNNGKYMLKGNILFRKNIEKKYMPVFDCQTVSQVKTNDKDATFRN